MGSPCRRRPPRTPQRRRAGIARGDGNRERRRADQRPAYGRVVVREQARQRHVDEGRVAQVDVAVGERELRRLDHPVQRELARSARKVEAFEDVERLAHGRAAARGRPHPEHLVAAVADRRRRAPDHLVRGEIGRRHQPRPHVARRVRRDRRLLDGPNNRVRKRAAVERAHPAHSQRQIRLRQVGVAEDRSHGRRDAVERAGRCEGVEAGEVCGDLVMEGLVDLEAAEGDHDPRRESRARAVSARSEREPPARGEASRVPRCRGRSSQPLRTGSVARWRGR